MGDDMEAMTGLYDALNSRDLTRAVERFADPEIELHSRLVETEGEVFHGHDGFRRWFALVLRAGKLRWTRFYATEEALEAVGLSE